ncbi:MAG: hypothetical protein WCJ95_17270 [Mariniphaga sp.]
MEKKIINVILGFFIFVSLFLFTMVVLELTGYEISFYDIGYAIGHFLKGIINLF